MRRIGAFVACLVMSAGAVVPATGQGSAGGAEPQGLQDLICFMMPWMCRMR